MNIGTRLRMQFEKDGSLTNTGYCGISVKAGESYSLYLFAKAKEEIGLDVAIEYQEKYWLETVWWFPVRSIQDMT